MQTENKHLSLLDYYIHVDCFGRIFFDKCKTNDEHMDAPVTPGSDRRRCRIYLTDLIPENLIGKKGVVSINIIFVPNQET